MDQNNLLHPADIAEQLAELTGRELYEEFSVYPLDIRLEIFSFFDSASQYELIKQLSEKELSEFLNNLKPDLRNELFYQLPDEMIKYLINLLNEREKQMALELIGYKEDSIARLMTPMYVQVRLHYTVADVFRHIKLFGRKAETLNFVYVVDGQNVLIDDLKIGQLLLADENTKISELVDYNFAAIRASTPMEEAFEIFQKYDRSALPIITDSGVLVGIVTFDDMLDRIEDRDTEDIHRFGGMDELDLAYTKTPLLELVRKRAGWLIILFLSEMLTASAMSYYDGEIAKAVVLALFVPLIISSGGNSGSQAASLIIRAMALGELKLKDWWYVMKREISSGIILGAILGSIGFIRILLWQQLGIYDYGEYWFYIGLSVSISLLFIVLWGTLSGSFIPFILRRLGMDPATASAPFVATLVDVSGLIIYFSIAAFFLSGKLL
ncbi:magnesium transporter [Sphingobacterium spiritivorum ATCC 33300]|uniref:Magnesium transporter MgtE n=1 Tax=Sphingobacterium spiritivorum ATCC 33300 TaxID=525372 RepID=C2FY81_SPHSI|nr:magnesium transporter [Sphingobacterium spiritivorum]EEI92134.1 magnesium transporter [Sphingobacterium spiritivorum ATCC 33300]